MSLEIFGMLVTRDRFMYSALLKALLSVKHEVKTKGSIYIVIIKLLFVHGIIKVLRILRTIVFYVRCGPISHMLRAPEVWV